MGRLCNHPWPWYVAHSFYPTRESISNIWPCSYFVVNPICLFWGRVSQYAQRNFNLKWNGEKIIFFFAVCVRIPKIYPRAWKEKFSNFGPLAWPPMRSSNMGPTFHDQTFINWKCSNFFKNQIVSTKFGHKLYFYIWNTSKIKECQFLQKFSIFRFFWFCKKFRFWTIFEPKFPIGKYIWCFQILWDCYLISIIYNKN